MTAEQLNKSEIKKINQELQELFGLEDFFTKKDTVVLVDKTMLLKNNKPTFYYHDNSFVPHLKLLLEHRFLPEIIVDRGAVPFVIKGADIMRPGIVSTPDHLRKEQLICIVDQTHKKPLAVGKILHTSEEIKEQQRGKSVKSLHYIGDELWKNY